MMLGIAASRSIDVAERLRDPRGAMWLMNSATATASGTAMTTARIAARTVPKASGPM